ncbi:MAG: hypothetical protein PVF63_02860 [Gammaproteobacteria bacterium]
MSDETGSSVACYYCGSSLAAAMPGRLEECANCGKYIHVCRMCACYDPRETSKQCREDDAEEVRDKQAANFCDYFRLAGNAFDAAGIRADTAARSQLADLFDDTEVGERPARPSEDNQLMQDAEALFKK